MLVKALKTFSGKVSMSKGTVKEIEDKLTLDDLIRAGYVEPAAEEAKVVKKPVEKITPTPKKVVEKQTK